MYSDEADGAAVAENNGNHHHSHCSLHRIRRTRGGVGMIELKSLPVPRWRLCLLLVLELSEMQVIGPHPPQTQKLGGNPSNLCFTSGSDVGCQSRTTAVGWAGQVQTHLRIALGSELVGILLYLHSGTDPFRTSCAVKKVEKMGHKPRQAEN